MLTVTPLPGDSAVSCGGMLTADSLTDGPGTPAVVKRLMPTSSIVHWRVYVPGVSGAILASRVTDSPGEIACGIFVQRILELSVISLPFASNRLYRS